MDSPIISELTAAKEKAWERLQTLAGLYVYYMNNRRDPIETGRNIRHSADYQTEAEMVAIRKLLPLKEDPVFVVPSGRNDQHASVLLTVKEHHVGVERSTMIPVGRIVTPEELAPPAPDRTTDDVAADLLRSLEP